MNPSCFSAIVPIFVRPSKPGSNATVFFNPQTSPNVRTELEHRHRESETELLHWRRRKQLRLWAMKAKSVPPNLATITYPFSTQR